MRQVLFFGWIIFAAGGILLGHRYENVAGSAIPFRSDLSQSSKKCTAYMFLHPQCSCSWASFNLLKALIAEDSKVCDFKLEFVIPEGADENFLSSNIYTESISLRNLKVELDPGGAKASRFGAQTSGYLVLFDRVGKCVFSGGLTAGRGVQGENLSTELVRRVLSNPVGQHVKTSVYGCQLL